MLQEITDKQTWNNFILGLNPNTFLHSWEWGQLQQATGERVRYLAFFNSSLSARPQAAALLIIVNAKRGRHYLIPHGPLFKNAADAAALLPEIIRYTKEHAQQDGCVALRIAPLIEATTENQKIFSALGFRPAPLHVHTELTWMVDINGSPEDVLQRMRKTTRHAIRKANANGVATEIITDANTAVSRFLPLYKKTTSRHGFVPFSRDFIKQQLNIFSASQHIFTVVARLGSQDVAAGIFVHFGRTIFYHHGASLKLSSNISPAHAVQWAAILEGKRRGAQQLNMWGIAPENQPNHPFAGITVFKKGFGGQAIDYLHAQDLPLSLGYWKLWIVDMYRKLRRGF